MVYLDEHHRTPSHAQIPVERRLGRSRDRHRQGRQSGDPVHERLGHVDETARSASETAQGLSALVYGGRHELLARGERGAKFELQGLYLLALRNQADRRDAHSCYGT